VTTGDLLTGFFLDRTEKLPSKDAELGMQFLQPRSAKDEERE